jgi:hypothetical protein
MVSEVEGFTQLLSWFDGVHPAFSGTHHDDARHYRERSAHDTSYLIKPI